MRPAFAFRAYLLARNAATCLGVGRSPASSTAAHMHALPGAMQSAAVGSFTTTPWQQMTFATSASDESNGPVYLVFGATGGIGSALAHRLAQSTSGAAPSALVLSAHHEGKLKELQKSLGSGSTSCEVHVAAADATDPQQVEGVLQNAAARYGRITGVVNCVGNVAAASALATDLQQLEDEVKVNLYTSFNIVRSAIKVMVQEEAQMGTATSSDNHAEGQRGGGSIVLVSAALASHGIPNYESMSAAKAGVEGLARSAAATYAAHNIRINCVAPGLSRTPQTKKFLEVETVARASEQMHPLKRLAKPQQIAAALEFFLSPENDFITGQVLAVDGGLSTLHPHRVQDYGV